MTVTVYKGVSEKREWPSREEWEKEQRRPYYDRVGGCMQGQWREDIEAYGNEQTITLLRAELRALDKAQLGRMRAERADPVVGPLLRQPKETQTQWVRRYFAMTEEDRRRLGDAYDEAQHTRRRIRSVLRSIDGDRKQFYRRNIPGADRYLARDFPQELPTLLKLVQAREEAMVKAREQALRKIAARPIDDAAWERELGRRRRIEGYEK